MAGEAAEDYEWALKCLHESWGRLPGVVASDCDDALTSALAAMWPETKHVLCMWHINKNVSAHAKKHFIVRVEEDGTEVGDHGEFFELWLDCVHSDTVDEFYSQFDAKLVARWGAEHPAVKYLLAQWVPHADKFVQGVTPSLPLPLPKYL
jgi:histone-lysine N-methyltransferase SETD2